MLYVGTSGFAYKEWKGSFYPSDLPQKKFLEYYASQFKSVEINNSFYRMPDSKTLAEWKTRVPSDFIFCMKMNKRVTHMGRLLDVEQPTQAFFGFCDALGEQQGPTLVQLPPNFQKNTERLAAFLNAVPPGKRVALEFRHASWFDDEVYELLAGADQALCLAEAEELSVPWVPTASWGYARLRELDYSKKELATRKRRVLDAKWKDAYVFFKHEDEGVGAKLAKMFLDIE